VARTVPLVCGRRRRERSKHMTKPDPDPGAPVGKNEVVGLLIHGCLRSLRETPNKERWDGMYIYLKKDKKNKNKRSGDAFAAAAKPDESVSRLERIAFAAAAKPFHRNHATDFNSLTNFHFIVTSGLRRGKRSTRKCVVPSRTLSARNF
jgi:hypothetical protein